MPATTEAALVEKLRQLNLPAQLAQLILPRRPKKSTNQPHRRWTERLCEKGWIPVSRTFWRSYSQLTPPLTIQEAAFVVHLMDFKSDERHAFPSYKRLARYMGVTDKMVRTYAKHLEEKKYLRRLRRVSKSNNFDLNPLFRALEALLDAEEEKKKAEEQAAADG